MLCIEPNIFNHGISSLRKLSFKHMSLPVYIALVVFLHDDEQHFYLIGQLTQSAATVNPANRTYHAIFTLYTIRDKSICIYISFVRKICDAHNAAKKKLFCYSTFQPEIIT